MIPETVVKSSSRKMFSRSSGMAETRAPADAEDLSVCCEDVDSVVTYVVVLFGRDWML